MATPAFWLPALERVPTEGWTRGEGDARIPLDRPILTPALLGIQIDALIEAGREVLLAKPIAEVVAAIDAVALRFLDPGDALRREALALLPGVTGLSRQMAERVLDRMAADWRRDRLERLLLEEFGDPAVLDGFAEVRGRRLRAIGPELVFHVFSGNVPGVGVTSLIRALLVKAPSLGKTASGEPVLPVLFARGLAEADPGLGRCVAVAYWPGGTEEMEGAAAERAEAVIAYGGPTAIESIRRRVPPGKRLLEYGSRLSFAFAAREALGDEVARALAADAALAVATFDQQGCVSPHLFYLEEGGEVSPREWARMLAGEMARVETELPRGRISPEEAAAIQQLRGRAEMAGLAGSGTEVHASPGDTAWTVVFDPDPRFDASCLNRTVRVKPVRMIDEVPDLVAHLGDWLQTVGTAGPDQRLTPVLEALARLGATRFAPFADIPWPEPWWHHDGRPPLGELVRWVAAESPRPNAES